MNKIMKKIHIFIWQLLVVCLLSAVAACITPQQTADVQRYENDKIAQELLAVLRPTASKVTFEIYELNVTDKYVKSIMIFAKAPIDILNDINAKGMAIITVQKTIEFLLDKGKDPYNNSIRIDCYAYGQSRGATGRESKTLFGYAEYNYKNDAITWQPNPEK